MSGQEYKELERARARSRGFPSGVRLRLTDSPDSGYEEEDREEARARGTGVGRRQAPDGSGQDRVSEPEAEQETSVPVNVGNVSAGVTARGPKVPRGDGGRGPLFGGLEERYGKMPRGRLGTGRRLPARR